MRVHELPSIQKRSQRIGRGGKRGSYSGRGVKGQKSRSGRRLRPAERDLILRLPKRRGFANPPKRERPAVFNLSDISQSFKSFATGKGEVELTIESLKVAGLLSKNFHGTVKLLGSGEVAFPVKAKGLSASESAKMKIEKAGGSVEQ